MEKIGFVWTALCIAYTIGQAASVEIDNGLAGAPQIECGDREIILSAASRNVFNGRLYVKGESNHTECVSVYGQQSTRNIRISVPLNSCNMRRLRIPGSGFEYAATIVISFHPIFETKVDRAYRVHCVFSQLNITFTAPSLEVSMIPTTETLMQTVAPTQCIYEVRRGSIHGPPVRFAVIGEPVFHVWKCETKMRILVRECFVDDGAGNKVATIDSRGCSVDRYVIQTPTYTAPDYNTVYTEAHVFKYADRPIVVFQCQIQLCDASDPTCVQTTPPVCEGAQAATVVPAEANATSPFSNATASTKQSPAIENDTFSTRNLTSEFNETYAYNISTPFPRNASLENRTSAFDIFANETMFANQTNATDQFPTPKTMILNATSENSTTFRFRRTLQDEPFILDSMVWDILSNEIMVMDLNQESQRQYDSPNSEEQVHIDRLLALPNENPSKIQQNNNAHFPDGDQTVSPCVASLDVAIAVFVSILLITAATSFAAVYLLLKQKRNTPTIIRDD